MKRHVLIHGISLLLAISLFLGATSCTKRNAIDETDEQRLTVETVTVRYTDELLAQASLKASEILARWLYLRDGLVMGETERASFAEQVRLGYLPVWEKEGVLEDELWRALSLAERACEEWEASDGSTRARTLLLCSYYRDLVAVLGSTRAGRVTYGGLCFYFEEQIAYNQARYEQYGLSWYDTAAKQASRRLEALQGEIGAEAFTDAMSVPAFAASVAAGAIPSAEAGVAGLLYDGDLVAILQRQGDYFSSLSVSEYQWYVIGDIWLSLAIGDAESLPAQMTATLHDEGIAARSALCIPELLTLYASLADGLDAASLAELRSAETEEARARAVCKLLSACDGELLTLLEKFRTLCACATERELTLIENAGLTDELAAFEQRTPAVSAQTFVSAIRAVADGSLSQNELRRAYLGFLRGTLPYFAFSIDTESHA